MPVRASSRSGWPPAARGKGLGRALKAAREEAARSEGVDRLLAGISGADSGPAAFHARPGFQTCGMIREAGRKRGQWLDPVLGQKIL